MKGLRVLLSLLLLLVAGPAFAQHSPDGSKIFPGLRQSLTTVAGTWTFGTTTPFGNNILLNGSSAAGGSGILLEAANSGIIFTKNSLNNWYRWTGSAWTSFPGDPLARAGATIHAQVHNAAGWLANHAYQTGARVNSGPGWNSASQRYVPYQTLRAYQVTGGSCVSGATAPTGVNASIPDGSCTWKFLSDTDYVTLTGWGNDAQPWSAQPYGYIEVVAAPDAGGILTQYRNENNTGCPAPSSAPPVTPRACGYNVAGNCVSTVAPPAADAGSNCTWVAVAPITYSSGNGFIPTQRFLGTNWAVRTYSQSYEADLWNDQQYAPGSNGEIASGLMLQNHSDSHAHAINFVITGDCGGLTFTYGFPITCPLIINAAPGESFADKLAANTSLPLRYDPSYGVTVYGFWISVDSVVTLRRLQLVNPVGQIFLHASSYDSIENSIVEVGTPSTSLGITPWAVSPGFNLSNSLVINHGANAVGYQTGYVGSVEHSTLVNPEGTGNLCIESIYDWVWYQGQFVNNTICAGYAHLNGAQANQTDPGNYINYNSDPVNTGAGSHVYTTSPNDTLISNPFPFTAPYSDGSTVSLNEYPVGGATYGISSTGLFMGPNDYRIPPTSPLRGVGANFGTVNRCPLGSGDPPCPFNYDTPDILGTARPTTGQDIGAWQTPGGTTNHLHNHSWRTH